MMIRLTVFLLSLLSTSTAFAAAEEPVFCSGADINMSGLNDCVSTCSAVSGRSGSQLGIGSDGMCHGTATYRKFNIYSIGLGQHALGTNEPVCEIFDGVVEITSSGQQAAFSGGSAIDLSTCPPGIYDLMFVTASRFETFKAETVYPDGSGKRIKTTSRFSNPNTATDYSDQTLYTETGTNYSDDTKGYMRPGSGYSNIYLKLGSAPVSADLDGSESATMIFDWMKMAVSGTSTSIRTGWYCEDITLCDRLNPNNNDRMDSVWNPDLDILEGMPITIEEDSITVPITISYFQTNRGSNEELGARFVWVNDGGTITALGVNPGDSGMYVTVGTPISESN